jgi:hypothetical protein
MHDIAVVAPLTAPPQSLPDPAPGSETACRDCPLRPLKLFHEPTSVELELLQSLKCREQHLGAGDTWKGGCAGELMPEVSRGQPLHTANRLT